MKNLIALIFLITISIHSYSQSSPDEIVETFFKAYQEQGSTEALNELYKSNKWIDINGAAMMNLKEKMETLTIDFVGEFNGYELIVEKKLADSFILRSYLVKFERQPIRFTFQFYRPDKTWKIQNFSYDGDIDEEIAEAAKLYYFRLN
jgi:hypothetical protein